MGKRAKESAEEAAYHAREKHRELVGLKAINQTAESTGSQQYHDGLREIQIKTTRKYKGQETVCEGLCDHLE